MKMSGMKLNMRACTGSAGAGFICVCSHCVPPMRIGQMPMLSTAGMKLGTP